MHFKRFWAPALTAVLLLAGPLCPAHAASVLLSFSGGSGSPLTITLAQPVTYTVDVVPANFLFFDFENVLKIFNSTASMNISGTMVFTINGGGPNVLDVLTNGQTEGTIAPADFILWKNGTPTVALGDVVVLFPGTLTTTVTSLPAPASGLYSAILVDSAGTQIAAGVPEPAGLSLLVVGGWCCLVRRRRTA